MHCSCTATTPVSGMHTKCVQSNFFRPLTASKLSREQADTTLRRELPRTTASTQLNKKENMRTHVKIHTFGAEHKQRGKIAASENLKESHAVRLTLWTLSSLLTDLHGQRDLFLLGRCRGPCGDGIERILLIGLLWTKCSKEKRNIPIRAADKVGKTCNIRMGSPSM